MNYSLCCWDEQGCRQQQEFFRVGTSGTLGLIHLKGPDSLELFIYFIGTTLLLFEAKF